MTIKAYTQDKQNRHSTICFVYKYMLEFDNTKGLVHTHGRFATNPKRGVVPSSTVADREAIWHIYQPLHIPERKHTLKPEPTKFLVSSWSGRGARSSTVRCGVRHAWEMTLSMNAYDKNDIIDAVCSGFVTDMGF